MLFQYPRAVIAQLLLSLNRFVEGIGKLNEKRREILVSDFGFEDGTWSPVEINNWLAGKLMRVGDILRILSFQN